MMTSVNNVAPTSGVQPTVPSPVTPNPENLAPQAIGDNKVTKKEPLNPQPSREEMIDWLQELGLSVMPECPIEAEKAWGAKSAKRPCYWDKASQKLIAVSWKNFQTSRPTPEDLRVWFASAKTQVGCLGGWNGTHWLAWIDFDLHHFESQTALDAQLAWWELKYPILGEAPKFRSPSGGYRYLIAFVQQPTNFGGNSGFCFTPDGKERLGELLTNNGGHTLLPPTQSYNGVYLWERWSKYPPVVETPEAIGLYPVGKKAPEPRTITPRPVNQGYVPGAVALDQVLCPSATEILQFGAKKGERSDAIAVLANEIFGWVNWLNTNNVPFNGHPYDLLQYAWDRMEDADKDPDKWRRCITKIESDSTLDPALYPKGGDEACWAKVRKLARITNFRNMPTKKGSEGNLPPSGDIGSGSGGNGGNGNGRGTGGTGGNGGSGAGGDGNDGNGNDKVVPFAGSETQDWVIPEIDKLIAQGVTGSHLTGKLNRLANASKIYVSELRTLYYERLKETDLENERGTHQGEIEQLLTITETSLELRDYLPPELAEPITLFCKWLSIRPAVALTALLAGISSVHTVGTELVIKKNQNFRVPPNIYAAIISPSGQKKSPILDNLITLPLNQLSDEKEDAYKAEMEDYETAMQAWEKAEEKGEKPKQPKEPTLYYFTNATGESIPVQAAKDPDKALLGLVDELSGLFNSANSYRGGRGGDKQDLLSYFDGRGQTVLRVPGVRGKLKKIYLSIFGTIQPPILKRHVEDCSDPDGQWARFLFVNQPLEAATLNDDDDEGVQLYELLTDVYRQIDNLPAMEYRLSKEASKRYQPIYKELERLRVTHPKAGMRAVFSKMEGYIGRLALNLHVLWSLAAGEECPDEEIPLSTLEKAIKLAKFYFGQVKLMHADSDDDSVPTQILRLIELSKRLNANGLDGWIKAQTYREQFASKKRPSAQQARDWMVEAVNLGYGRTRGSGNRLEYHWNFGDDGGNNDGGDNDKIPPTAPDDLGNLGKLREDLGKGVPYVETVENKGFEDNLGNLGKGYPPHPQQHPVEESLRQTDTPCVNDGEPNSDPEPPEVPLTWDEPETPTLPKSAEGGGSVPEASLTSPNVDSVDDTDLGNPFPNHSLSFPKSSLSDAKTQAQTLDNNLIELGAIATEMIHCDTPADVEKLYASVPQELIEATKGVLGEEERLTFEAIANQCANPSPAAVEVAQQETPDPTPKVEALTPVATTNKDASTTVGTQFRYVGVLTHNLKDAEGNPILDAEGKPLVLKGGSELILEEVERSVNADYANVRPLGVDCRPLGLRRSQLEEV